MTLPGRSSVSEGEGEAAALPSAAPIRARGNYAQGSKPRLPARPE